MAAGDLCVRARLHPVPFALLISLYFYYWIGSTLERQWGTAKFNLYYISGTLLTVLGVVLASLITGNPYLTAAGTGYVNLSMFFAFAFLFPDTTVLLFFILPVKMKWLAYLDGALFAFDIIKAIGAHNWAGVVLPIVALLNFAVFIWPEVHYLRQRDAVPELPQDRPVPSGPSSGPAGAASAVSPQVRRVRTDGYGLPRASVPLLQQVRRVPLLLSGPHLQPRAFHGGITRRKRAAGGGALFCRAYLLKGTEE